MLPPAALTELTTRPWSVDFHQALRRIDASFPHLPRAGHAPSPRLEPIRLGQDPALAFAPAALARFQPPSAGSRGRLLVGFLGLLGPQGALPLHVTELAHERARAGDCALSDFLNLFQHRMLLLLHRAWASADAAAREDRPHDGAFRRYLSALCGQPAPAANAHPAVSQRAHWAFSACFLHPARPPAGLETVLSHYFGCTARVHCFVPDWLELPPSLGWRLGCHGLGQLGVSTVVGRRVYQPSQKFRVELGPLSHAAFEQLLPGAPGFTQLSSLLGSYAGPELRWELLLRLEQSEQPALHLGKRGRLGRDAWLAAGPGEGGLPDKMTAEPRHASRGRNSGPRHVLIHAPLQQS